MQTKLKIITVFAIIFILVAFIIKYSSTIDYSTVSFRNYLQDISGIIKGNVSIPEYKHTPTTVNKNEELYEAMKNEFDYNAPITEIDTKSLLQTAKPKVYTYENRIRLELPEELDENGLYVALMQAVADNNMKRAKTLIARGARLNTPDGDTSFAPIFWAIDNGNVEMVRLLISKGAKVNTPDDKGLFPIHWIVNAASKRPHVYQMKKIFDIVLEAHPTEINRQDTKLKQTPIMLAVLSDNKKAFAYLLDKGANITLINWEKMNVVNMAISNGCHSCVALIEEKEKINKLEPLDNFAKTFKEPDPIWLPYTVKKSTTTAKKKTVKKKYPSDEIVVISGDDANLTLPTYKEMPQILPLTEEEPDIVRRSR